MSKDSTGDNIINAGLYKGFTKLAAEHIENAKLALNRGADEQANEHLKRVGDSISGALLNPSESRLTPDENEEYRRLTNLRFYKDEKSGLIGERHISDQTYNRLQTLDKKARGEK